MKGEKAEAAEKGALAAIGKTLGWLSAGMLVLITTVTIGSVVGRAVLGRPIPDSEGISEMLNAAAVFLALGYVQLVKGHVEVTIATDWLPPRALAWMKLPALVISLVAFAIMAAGMAIGTWEAWDFDDVYVGEYTIPTWPARLVATFGAFMLVLHILVDVVAQFAEAANLGGTRQVAHGATGALTRGRMEGAPAASDP